MRTWLCVSLAIISIFSITNCAFADGYIVWKGNADLAYIYDSPDSQHPTKTIERGRQYRFCLDDSVEGGWYYFVWKDKDSGQYVGNWFFVKNGLVNEITDNVRIVNYGIDRQKLQECLERCGGGIWYGEDGTAALPDDLRRLIAGEGKWLVVVYLPKQQWQQNDLLQKLALARTEAGLTSDVLVATVSTEHWLRGQEYTARLYRIERKDNKTLYQLVSANVHGQSLVDVLRSAKATIEGGGVTPNSNTNWLVFLGIIVLLWLVLRKRNK